MRLGMFSLEIVGGRETDGGYVEVEHGQHYKLRLTNLHPDRRADVEVRVDGGVVGVWRVDPGRAGDPRFLGFVEIERPISEAKLFTFYRTDTHQAIASGETAVAREEKGLIQATFRAERVVPYGLKEAARSAHPRVPEPEEKTVGGLSYAAPVTRGGEPIVRTRGGDPPATHRDAGPLTRGGQHTNSSKSYAAGVTGLSGRSDQRFTNAVPIEYDPALETVITLRLLCVEADPTPLHPPTPLANSIPKAL